MRKQWGLLVLAAALFVVSLPSSNAAQKRGRSTVAIRKAQAPKPGSVEQFKDAFQKDADNVKLVALISPT
ncbi:MAG TPA: hypothetical protein VGV87_14655 [Blastocatellia bacterium]|jgi:hypothetical protein|nr:hypothetical protein [Blastocatellia bacterium]